MNKPRSHTGQRNKYDPDIHDFHKTPWSRDDDDYLMKFYKADGMAACSLALGRTEMAVSNRVRYLLKKQAR